MATATPIRFRCFQCHKLLGVSRSKANSVVACPQCAAELIVPEPEDDDSGASASPPSSPPPPRTPEPDNRPSASRVMPAVVPWDAPPGPDSSVTEAPAPAPEPSFPLIQTEPISLRPEPPARTRTSSRPRAESPRVSVEEILTTPPPAPAAPPDPILNIEAPSLRPEGLASPIRERAPRRDDVVLPRTAVLLWSFLVLMALVLAFAAGLLAGRFVWASRARAAGGVSLRRSLQSPAAPDMMIASAPRREYN